MLLILGLFILFLNKIIRCSRLATLNALENVRIAGRLHLMQILSRCIYHLHENAENASVATDHLYKMISSTVATAPYSLVERHELYQALIEFPDNESKLNLDKLKMNIMMCEDLRSLKTSNAIVGFKQ
jgi:hypothetical protein